VNAATPTIFQAASAGVDSHPERAPLSRIELLLIFGFWTLIAFLTVANTFLDIRGRELIQSGQVGERTLLAFAESYIWMVLTPFVFRLTSRYSIERINWVSRVVLYVGVGLLIGIVVDMATDYLRYQLMLPMGPGSAIRHAGEIEPVTRVRRLWFMNEFTVYVAMLAAGFARNYFLRYRVRREEAVKLQAQAAQLQAQLADARLSALRMQLNPHFLFNTLHAISALVERDPRGVRRMIARLSELLRTTLDADDQEVPLHQEIAFNERYLEIMQIRFQGHLEVETHVPADVREAMVPNFILQPLVENAVKHGVSKINEPGHIEISARREGGQLIVTLRDNGPVIAGEPSPTEGIGLRNTRARLAQLYGNDQSLTLRPAPDGGLIAEVALPFHTQADLRATAFASDKL
jgi:two-component system, LytTR family, sensor kinase